MTARELVEELAAEKAAANKRYRNSEKGKRKTREAYKRYRKTEKGREARRRNK